MWRWSGWLLDIELSGRYLVGCCIRIGIRCSGCSGPSCHSTELCKWHFLCPPKAQSLVTWVCSPGPRNATTFLKHKSQHLYDVFTAYYRCHVPSFSNKKIQVHPPSVSFSSFFIIDRAGEFPRLDPVLAGPFRCISRVRGWEVGSHQFQELKCGAFLTWGAPKSSKIGHFQLENQWFTGLRFTQILRTSACVARSKHGFGSPYWGHRSI